MKDMLALTLSVCFISTMTHASDARFQLYRINLHADAKEKLKKHMIAIAQREMWSLPDPEYLNHEPTDVSVRYYPSIKIYDVRLCLINANPNYELGDGNVTSVWYNKNEFNTAIGEPTESCCC
ncbi:MAG TPA: hypothetical protein VLG50_08540 [Candidatus Saccharimonadales bacterium]|nr:hypothetical protein [Candidatus Saccharimonadales bacterium]